MVISLAELKERPWVVLTGVYVHYYIRLIDSKWYIIERREIKNVESYGQIHAMQSKVIECVEMLLCSNFSVLVHFFLRYHGLDCDNEIRVFKITHPNYLSHDMVLREESKGER